MRLYLQWAKSQAEDWAPFDITSPADVRRLPRRAVPRSSDRVDNKPGWVNALNCQGIVFHGYDHIAVEYNPLTDAMTITGWQDDDEDFPADERWATRWTFLPPAPDPAVGGQVNARQSRVVFATPAVAAGFPPNEVRPWEQFVPPAENLTLHGIWMQQDLYDQHMNTLSVRGWREWVR